MKERVWLVDLRKEKGFTQEQLAELIGISNKHISQIETGRRNPSGKVAAKWAKVLEFEMVYFFASEFSLEEKREKQIS